MYNEQYVFRREIPQSYGARVEQLIIILRNLPKNTESHEELKENVLKYIDFDSALRLSPGNWNPCSGDCKERLTLSFDDVKEALSNAISRVCGDFSEKIEKLNNDKKSLEKNIEDKCALHNTRLLELLHAEGEVPARLLSLEGLRDEISILEDLLRMRKDDVARLSV